MFHGCPSAQSAGSEKQILLAWRSSLLGFRPDGYVASWDAARDMCSWGGITCDSQGYVIEM